MGRDLHEFLGIKDNYTDWFKRMVTYGFEPEIDFSEFSDKSLTSGKAGRKKIGHVMTLDMAKEVAMIQRTDKGKRAHCHRAT